MSMIINPYVFAAGGGTPAPSTLTDIWEWWEPSREIGYVDGNSMSGLTGQKNARNMTAGVSGVQKPTFDTAQINSLAAARFDTQFFTFPDISALTIGHIFLIIKVDSDPPGVSGVSGIHTLNPVGASANHYPFTDGTIYDQMFSTVRKTTTNPTSALTGWRVYEVLSKSGEWTRRIDGATTGNDFYTTATNTVGMPAAAGGTSGIEGRIGQSYAAPATYLSGWIAGIYLANAELTSTPRGTLITYINSRFGLSSG